MFQSISRAIKVVRTAVTDAPRTTTIALYSLVRDVASVLSARHPSLYTVDHKVCQVYFILRQLRQLFNTSFTIAFSEEMRKKCNTYANTSPNMCCRTTLEKWSVQLQSSPRGTPTKFGRNRGGVALLSRKPAMSFKQGKIGPRLLLMTNSWVSIGAKINDL